MKKRKLNRLLIILALASLVGIAAVTWWSIRNTGSSDAVLPSTATVIRRDFTSSVLATGAVKPQVGAEVRVGARISGKVERLHANIGDFVKKGQVLAELEKDDLAAEVAQSRAEFTLAEARLSAVEALRPREVEKAEAEVAQRLATLTFAKKDLARQGKLLRQNVASQQAWDRAQEKLSVAEAQYAAALNTLELARKRYTEDIKQAKPEIARAKAALDYVRVRLSYATITAPIDGVIASVATQRGETVAAGLNAPTFVTIIDLQRLQVDAFVDEVDIGKITIGQKAEINIRSYPDDKFMGEVREISPSGQGINNIIKFEVIVMVTKAPKPLRPGMTADVDIIFDERDNIPQLPIEAVTPKETIQIKTDIKKAVASKLSGQKIDLTLASYPDLKFAGKVNDIAPARPGFSTSEVTIIMDGSPKELQPDTNRTANIKLSDGTDIPNIEARIESKKEYFVKFVKEGEAESEAGPEEENKMIEVGERTQNNIEILGGLKVGDKVRVVPPGEEEEEKKK